MGDRSVSSLPLHGLIAYSVRSYKYGPGDAERHG